MTTARLKQIRMLLWLYLWLLIFEGALRKWVLPGLANPLLLVRDPVALLALVWGWPLLRRRQWQQWLQPLFVIGPLSFLFAITVGHGDLFTAFYGARVLVLQLPLIFVFASVFDREDVIRLAWLMLWLSIPMTVLLVLQSNQPDTNILNVGSGGIGTASFSGAMDRSRPSATFSFITGVVAFYSLAAASLFIVLYNSRIRQGGRLICIVAGVALVVALPVSISRSMLAGYIMVVVAAVTAMALARAKLWPLFVGLLALALAIAIATTIPAFQDTSEAFLARWETAGASSGDDRSEVGDLGIAAGQIQGRVLPGFTTPFEHLANVPILGYGVGMGSNVGAQRLGNIPMVLGEGGWEVSFGELGLVLGLAFVIWRIALAIWILRLALLAATRGNQLPLILAGASFLTLMQGQLSQPTGLGFIVVTSGFTLAAFNSGYQKATTFRTHHPNAKSVLSPSA
jgi:hypothetical protein